MERENTARVQRKLKSVNQLIREAEAEKARGIIEAEEVNKLRRERAERKISLRTASNEDYVIDRNRRRENRSKFKKVIDTLTMDA